MQLLEKLLCSSPEPETLHFDTLSSRFFVPAIELFFKVWDQYERRTPRELIALTRTQLSEMNARDRERYSTHTVEINICGLPME